MTPGIRDDLGHSIRVSVVENEMHRPRSKEGRRPSSQNRRENVCDPITSRLKKNISNPCLSKHLIHEECDKRLQETIRRCSFSKGVIPTPREKAHNHHTQSPSGQSTMPHARSSSTISSGSTAETQSSSGSSSGCYPQACGDEIRRFGPHYPVDMSRLRHRMDARSMRKPPRSCDLIVTVGTDDFFYSSGILTSFSDYLSTRSVQRDHDGRYYVSFPYHTAEEWRPFVGFIQSYLVRPCELTWKLAPVVLPWFFELGMDDLLDETDKFLIAEVTSEQTRQGGCSLSVENVLLLANIALSCGLDLTAAQAKAWLKQKLQEPRDEENETDDRVGEDEEVFIQWSLQDIQSLCKMLVIFDDLRTFLWESTLILYLPHDLNVTDSLSLVTNPLFPYLLREGMMQLAVLSKNEMGFEEEEESAFTVNEDEVGSKITNITFSSDVTMPTKHLEPVKPRMCQDTLQRRLQLAVDNLEKFQNIRQRVHQDILDMQSVEAQLVAQEEQNRRYEQLVVEPLEPLASRVKQRLSCRLARPPAKNRNKLMC